MGMKFFLPLFPLNRYNSAPIGQIWIRKIWACRTRIALSSDPGQAFVGSIVSEKKIVKKKFFFPFFPLNHYNSASIGQIFIKKYGRVGREEPFPVTPVRLLKIFFSFVPFNPLKLGSYWSDLDKKIWACRARRALSNGLVGKFFLPLFPLNRYNSAPIGQIWIRKIWACRTRIALSSDSVRARRAPCIDPGSAFVGAILSEKKIVKEKFFFPFFPLNRYNSAPICQMSIKKIWSCSPRRSLSNGPRRSHSSDPPLVFPGAIVSEKKIVTEKFFFPLSLLNSYNSVPIGQILIKKIWACRARRALSNDPGPVFLDAILSEKKIILIKKIWACRQGRSHSNDPGLVFLGATLSEKKIVKEKFFFPLFSLNQYNSAPVGQILI
ncbi:hypothetical protein V1477_017794 [Vespula maculifrons]|uniref:Uncharacterized protein n=1 Tax=Vespula maculifrons TaxID=7453 RepID=A0ABD2B156_VESMC